MKRDEIVKRIKKLACDSWAFLNWEDVPKRATKFEMVEALLKDRRWIEDHCSEVCKQVDALRFDIEYGVQPAPEKPGEVLKQGQSTCWECGRSKHDADLLCSACGGKPALPSRVEIQTGPGDMPKSRAEKPAVPAGGKP